LFTREKSYFSRATPEGNMTISRVNKFISPLCKGNECFIPPGISYLVCLESRISYLVCLLFLLDDLDLLEVVQIEKCP